MNPFEIFLIKFQSDIATLGKARFSVTFDLIKQCSADDIVVVDVIAEVVVVGDVVVDNVIVDVVIVGDAIVLNVSVDIVLVGKLLSMFFVLMFVSMLLLSLLLF